MSIFPISQPKRLSLGNNTIETFGIIHHMSRILNRATLGATLISFSFFGQAELLFEDDFSTGDLSKSNNYFRWGRDGTIHASGYQASMVESITGPQGAPVNAMRFNYGTWQEIRFHLTNSLSEVRSESALSNTSYNDVWISYDMLIPANYKHNSTGGDAGHNNKGFLTLWKGLYDSNSELFSLFQFWPASAKGGDPKLSYLTMTTYGSYIHTSAAADSHLIPGTDSAYAFLESDFGRWRNFTMHLFAGSADGANDGIAELYKDGVLAARFSNINYQMAAQAYGTQLNGDMGFDRGYILGYHNSGYDSQTIFRVANFKFGTSKGAVMPFLNRPVAPSALTVDIN